MPLLQHRDVQPERRAESQPRLHGHRHHRGQGHDRPCAGCRLQLGFHHHRPADVSWAFTTSACSQLPVALRSAANFVVLAGSTVTNTGPTLVTGDLGVSPGTAITGFLPGVVIGTTHAGTPTSAQAIADLTTAYNDVAGRVLCPLTIAGNLGGMTLAPGLYKSTSSLGISSGDLTLDAQGDGQAIFLFQMASTFTTSAGRQVILANGARRPTSTGRSEPPRHSARTASSTGPSWPTRPSRWAPAPRSTAGRLHESPLSPWTRTSS